MTKMDICIFVFFMLPKMEKGMPVQIRLQNFRMLINILNWAEMFLSLCRSASIWDSFRKSLTFRCSWITKPMPEPFIPDLCDLLPFTVNQNTSSTNTAFTHSEGKPFEIYCHPSVCYFQWPLSVTLSSQGWKDYFSFGWDWSNYWLLLQRWTVFLPDIISEKAFCGLLVQLILFTTS